MIEQKKDIKKNKPMKYSVKFGWMLKHDRINNPLSFIKKAKQTKVHILSTLSRDVEMVHTSEYEKENSCNVLIVFLNEISLFQKYVWALFIIREIE